MRLFALSAMIFLSGIFASAQINSLEKVNDAIANRDLAIAQKLLQDSSGSEHFKINNFEYLLGRVAAKNGDLAVAAASFQRVAESDSVLREYALWHLAEIAKLSGNGLLERIYLYELTAFHHDSLLANAAKNRIARSLFDSGDLGSSVAAFNGLKTLDRTQGPSRENMTFVANAYLNLGMSEQARAFAERLISETSDAAQPDDQAYAGAQILDRLDEAEQRPITELEHLNRASIYQFNRDLPAARKHYLAILNDFPAGNTAPEATMQIGIGYTRELDFAESLEWFERLLEQFPEHELREEALLQSAAAYARLGKYPESIRRYENYIELYPNGKRIDRAYLNTVDTLRDSHENTIAIRWAKLTQERFAGELPAALALFAEARVYIARSQWPEAIDALERLNKMPELGGASVPGGTSKEEIAFLRAFCLEQSRRYEEAINAYLAIPDGREEYFGNIATDRLQAIGNDALTAIFIAEKLEIFRRQPRTKEVVQATLRMTSNTEKRRVLLDELAKIYQTLASYKLNNSYSLLPVGRKELTEKAAPDRAADRHKIIADELVFLGLYDEAAPEFEAAQHDRSIDANDLAYTIAELYRRGGKADRGIKFMQPRWKVPADLQVELMPKSVAQFLYPVPYRNALIEQTAGKDIDPRFMLSIMRQESRFRPNARSFAAARGLMQFVSTTSERIAGELGRDEFLQQELYDPRIAIMFGSQYLFDLYRIFPNQTEAVAASYNGGEENVKRWLVRSHSNDADIYVSEIAYAQTKDYVFHVMTNYRVYRELYDADLSLRP